MNENKENLDELEATALIYESESRDMISAKDALASENPAAEIDAPKTDR